MKLIISIQDAKWNLHVCLSDYVMTFGKGLLLGQHWLCAATLSLVVLRCHRISLRKPMIGGPFNNITRGGTAGVFQSTLSVPLTVPPQHSWLQAFIPQRVTNDIMNRGAGNPFDIPEKSHMVQHYVALSVTYI